MLFRDQVNNSLGAQRIRVQFAPEAEQKLRTCRNLQVYYNYAKNLGSHMQ